MTDPVAAAQRKLAPRKTTSRQEELGRLVTAAKAKPFWLDRPDAPLPASRYRATERATWR
jgi:hypothetical protein